MAKKDEDRVYIVDGRERTGKSVFALQQAKYIDPTFNINRVCFSPEEFLECINTAKKGQVIVFDEAFRGLSSKSTQSRVNKKIVQAMMEMGQRNLTVFIVLPTIFLLEMYAAVLRSNALFRVIKNPRDRTRRIKVYNEYKKNLLYHVGKKKGFSYAFPKVLTSAAFFNIYAIDEEVYRKKKLESLRQDEKKVELSDREVVSTKRFENLVYIMLKDKKLSQKALSELLEGQGIEYSRQSLGLIMAKIRKEVENKENTTMPGIKRSNLSYGLSDGPGPEGLATFPDIDGVERPPYIH